MPTRFVRPAVGDNTRQRILKAAMLRFSSQSYESTGLRDIASDVGVDMAYVHRSFGSKEKLFRAAVEATLMPDSWLVAEPADLHRSLVADLLADKGADEIRPFDIVVRSFSSPDASRVLREIMEENFVSPFVSKCPQVSKERASMIVAVLAGVGIFRDVVNAPALQGGERDTELGDVLANVIALLMNEGAEGQAVSANTPIEPEPL